MSEVNHRSCDNWCLNKHCLKNNRLSIINGYKYLCYKSAQLFLKGLTSRGNVAKWISPKENFTNLQFNLSRPERVNAASIVVLQTEKLSIQDVWNFICWLKPRHNEEFRELSVNWISQFNPKPSPLWVCLFACFLTDYLNFPRVKAESW